MEHRLVKEEADLEEVRDSLKGRPTIPVVHFTISLKISIVTDKTDQFTTQIDDLQRELEPWVAKINERQSAADIAESEKKTLSGKAIAGQKAVDTAHSTLEALIQAVQSKVSESDFRRHQQR